MLDIKHLEAGYEKKQVLYDISMSVQEREFVGIVGHNGAGKSTLLKTIFGIVKPYRGKITYMGEDSSFEAPIRKLEKGMCHIPQENFIFNRLSVRDNMELALFTSKDKFAFESKCKDVFAVFPILKARQNQLGGTLSGGERRILSIAMGFLRQPRLLMLDEPSGGLSPIAFKNVIKTIQDINSAFGTAILLVEQNVRVTFNLCRRVYVMKAGHIILEETGQALLARKEWWDLF